MRYLLTGLFLFFNLAGYNQEKRGLTYRKLSPFINLSVTGGIGPGHAYYAMPSADLKFGRFSYSLSYLQANKSSSGAIQIEADVKYWNTTGKYVKSISLTLGDQNISDHPWSLNSDQQTLSYLLAGYNLYSKNFPGRLSFKLGIAEYKNRESGHAVTRTIPYAGISYRLYVAQPKLLERPLKNAVKTFLDTMLPKYFNPGIVWGLGGAGILPLLPGLSLRSGPFTLETGTTFDVINLRLVSGVQLKADVYELREKERAWRYLTATLGRISFDHPWDENFTYLLTGINYTRKQSRLVFDFKLGAGIHSQDGERYVYPYGQLTVGAHLFRIVK